MPARNAKELHQDQIRSVALMYELMCRTGCTNPHQFAGWFDQLTHNHTQDSGKWRAIWGETADLIACIRSHPKSSSKMPFVISERAVQLSIITAAKDEISFADFVRAIALYRLRKETEPFARIDGIGLNLTGTVWQDIQSCLKENQVMAELDRLGLKQLVTEELEQLEAERRRDNPKAHFFD